ncbi:MAG: hypothetical protein ABTD50_10060 [Polyangiaceae bacterium]
MSLVARDRVDVPAVAGDEDADVEGKAERGTLSTRAPSPHLVPSELAIATTIAAIARGTWPVLGLGGRWVRSRGERTRPLCSVMGVQASFV